MGDRRRTYLWWLVPLLFGLIIGWFLLGWLIAPVKWSNAGLQDLDPTLKSAYVVTAAEAFAQTQDSAKAIERLQGMGTQVDVAAIASDAVAAAEASGDLVTADRIRAMAAAVNLPLDVPAAPAQTQEGTDQAQEGGNSSVLTILGLLLIAGGIALAAWLLLRRRSASDDDGYQDDEMQTAAAAAPAGDRSVAASTAGAAPSEPPGQRFRAEFNQGDKTFDESFDIEGPDGTYLGECGVTISETVDGDPDRATALEVWLFDKSDIRTVTKVLMTDYAYGNPPLREKLSSRGDAVLLSQGIGFVLDAQTLRLAGKVMDMEYDQASAPPSSTIRHLMVELRVIQQPPAG